MKRDLRGGPPRRLEALLGRVVPDGAAGRSSVLGDLHEEYLDLRRRRGRRIADLWYAAQVVALAVPWVLAAARARGAEVLSGWTIDLRATLRGLARHPTLVVVGVGSLTLGSGLVTAASTVTNGAWFAPLPWPDADRLVDLEDTHPIEVCRDCSPGTSLRAFEIWRADLAGLFTSIEATDARWGTLRAGAAPMEIRISQTTPGMAELLDLKTGRGRFLVEEDTRVGAERVAVLGHGVWTRAFGGEPDVVGREVELDGTLHTVVGVLSPESRPLTRSDVFIPIRGEDARGDFGERGLWVVGRLAPGVSVGAADEALAALASAIYEDAPALERGWSARAVPLRTVLARSGASPGAALAILALCLIVLLVAALNLATLLLARATQRSHELGVRSALGAGRLRVARAAVLDALVLASAGGLGGLVLTWTARDAVVAAFANELPPWVSFPIDLRVMAATICGVAVAATVTGLLPLVRSLYLDRGPGPGGALSVRRHRRSRAPDLLLGAQIVLGLVLVAGSVGALRTFVEVSDFDRLGFRWNGLTDIRISVPSVGEGDEGAVASLSTRLDDALGAHSGLERYTLFRSLFLGSWGSPDAASPVRVAGAVEPMPDHVVPRHSLAVGPGYFELLEIPLLAGRAIVGSDREGESPVAVVSEDAAGRMWPDRPADEVVGEAFTVTVGETEQTFTVVGVAAPVVARAWSENALPEPRIYTALGQTPDDLYGGSPGSAMIIRADPRGTGPSPTEWTAWLDRVAPGAGVQSVTSVEDALRESIRGIWLTGMILTGLAVLVMALLAVGIYGTVSYRVATARRELGIRLALGARATGIVRAVGGRLARVVALALALGAVMAWGADRVLAAGGVPVGDADPRVLLTVAVLIACAAALACASPLRRALRIDPARSLRSD